MWSILLDLILNSITLSSLLVCNYYTILTESGNEKMVKFNVPLALLSSKVTIRVLKIFRRPDEEIQTAQDEFEYALARRADNLTKAERKLSDLCVECGRSKDNHYTICIEKIRELERFYDNL